MQTFLLYHEGELEQSRRLNSQARQLCSFFRANKSQQIFPTKKNKLLNFLASWDARCTIPLLISIGAWQDCDHYVTRKPFAYTAAGIIHKKCGMSAAFVSACVNRALNVRSCFRFCARDFSCAVSGFCKSLQFWPKICRPAVDIESSIHPQGVSPSQEDRKELLITGKSERMGFWIV